MTEDPNLDLFCKKCGTLVPFIPGKHSCPLCKEHFDISKVKHSKIEINVLQKDDDINSSNIKVERAIIQEKCPKCGETGLYYNTAQIRSADEGQTIYYECVSCQYKYSVNS